MQYAYFVKSAIGLEAKCYEDVVVVACDKPDIDVFMLVRVINKLQAKHVHALMIKEIRYLGEATLVNLQMPKEDEDGGT